MKHFLSEERIRNLKKIYNHGIMGRNSKQQTVIVDRIGNIKLNELGKLIEDEEIIGYINQRMLNLS